MAFNSKLATFSFFLFVIGMILTYLSYSQHAKISYKCTSKQVQIGMNILLVLSTMMMIIPFVQLVCHWGCECPQNDLWYRGIIISLSALLMITASVVLNGLKDDCDTKSVRDFMIGLIVIGVIIIVVVGILPFAIPSMGEFFNGSDSYYPNNSVDEV
jgi:hypothetical protein